MDQVVEQTELVRELDQLSVPSYIQKLPNKI